MNAQLPHRFHVVLRDGLSPPEATLLKLHGRQLVDENGAALVWLQCKTFEQGDYFAKIAVIDPDNADITFDLQIPLHLILMVTDMAVDAEKPFGFTPG